jgi:hypothetical protein
MEADRAHNCRSACDDAFMADLDARPVDPRDRRWEVWNPRYRVHFWRRVGDGYASREFDIASGEVDAALAWIGAERAGDETFTLFALVDRGDDRGQVRLAGSDPTRDA